MHKFGSLYRNEITKTVRKPVYIVITALVLASMLLVGIIALGAKLLNSAGAFDYTPDRSVYVEQMEWNENDYRSILSSLESEMKAFEDTYGGDAFVKDGKFDAEAAIEDYRARLMDDLIWYADSLCQRAWYLESLKFKIADIDDEEAEKNPAGFIDETRENLAGARAYGRTKADLDKLLKDYPTVGKTVAEYPVFLYGERGKSTLAEAELLSKNIEKYEEILANEDFDLYIDLENETVKSDPALSESQKKIGIETNEILKKLYRPNMTSVEWNEVTSALSTLNTNKMLLDAGTDWEGNKLSPETVTKYRLQVEELTKGLEYGAPGYGGRQSVEEKVFVNLTLSAGMGVAQVLLVIKGALLVAEEFQSGSIKLLIIAPVRRIKIFSAKLLMLATMCAFEMLLVYFTLLFVCLFSGLGFSNMVFTFAGSAHVMNPFLYYFIYVLLGFVEVFAAGVFALMLSTMIRNAGGAISISMVLVYVLQSSVTSIFMLTIGFTGNYIFSNIYKVLPPANADLPSKLFGTSIQSDLDLNAILNGGFGLDINNGFAVSLLYVLAFGALCVWASYESFIKRDIK